MHKTNLHTLADLYYYFDHIVEQDADTDTLFASSYIRGFISVEAVNFGDDLQELSKPLFSAVTHKIQQAKQELSPRDSAIVQNFWLILQNKTTNIT